MARRIGKRMRSTKRREIQRVLHAIDATKGTVQSTGDDDGCEVIESITIAAAIRARGDTPK